MEKILTIKEIKKQTKDEKIEELITLNEKNKGYIKIDPLGLQCLKSLKKVDLSENQLT